MTLKDPQKYDGVVSQVSGMDGVGNVNSLQELLGPLFEILSKMRWASLGTSLLLMVAAILQVSNTIRMTAYARRREIGIMRLVGASSWHIQLPFILESMLAALISAALAAAGLAAFMYFVVYGYLRDTLGEITTWVRWRSRSRDGLYDGAGTAPGAGSDTRDDAQVPRRLRIPVTATVGPAVAEATSIGDVSAPQGCC